MTESNGPINLAAAEQAARMENLVVARLESLLLEAKAGNITNLAAVVVGPAGQMYQPVIAGMRITDLHTMTSLLQGILLNMIGNALAQAQQSRIIRPAPASAMGPVQGHG